jgi:SNF2 family DNA or RNA helicase
MEEEGEEHSAGIEKHTLVAKDPEETTIYSSVRDTILNQIKNIDLDGSFGTKIDTLARHVLWIREHDPAAKSIVFSQYRDFLDVLARAFGQFKIGFTGIDRKDGIQKFKYDPSMECFFLHAKAHSSGLNLVNATHVFLCEPLINTAIELQYVFAGSHLHGSSKAWGSRSYSRNLYFVVVDLLSKYVAVLELD